MHWDSSDAESDYQARKVLRDAEETVRQRREKRPQARGEAPRVRVIKPWRWIDRSAGIMPRGGKWELVDGQGRDRATIWQNDEKRFTWHTWDDQGTGGENAEATSLDDAKRHCVAAIVRQGWAPGGWEVRW